MREADCLARPNERALVSAPLSLYTEFVLNCGGKLKVQQKEQAPISY